MPRNGSGVYGPPAGTTAVPNTPIESAKYNAFVTDAAEALTNSVNVSGTAPFQANQPMGGFKHTNLGSGSAAGDSLNLGQAQSNIVGHATAVGGTADAITATFSPAFAAWTAKMRFRFTAAGANTVTDPTINVDGLGAKTLKKLNGQALAVGDIAGSGHVIECVYDGTDVLVVNAAPQSQTSVGKHTISIPGSAIIPRPTNGPSIITLESTSHKVVRKGLAFDKSTIEYGQFFVPGMPKGWNAGTVTARFTWEHPSAVTNFAVVWGIQGLAVSDNESLDQAFGSLVTVTDTGGTTPNEYKTAETDPITLGNTPAKGDGAYFQVSRVATDGADTLDVDAYLIGIELYYTTDAPTDA